MNKAHKKPIPFKVPRPAKRALVVQVDEGASFYSRLHYHPEIQITAIAKGDGFFYAGNSISSFGEKEVLIIGSNVPHLMKNSPQYYTEESPGIYAISIFFEEASFGKTIFDTLELGKIKNLLQQSQRVIKVAGDRKEDIFHKIIASKSTKGVDRVIGFFEILNMIEKSEKIFLNSELYKVNLDEKEGTRLHKVLDHTFKYFQQEITIEEIAEIACLSRSQFSHFFKTHTGKTYIQLLNEFRIENACNLLTHTDYTIGQACFESGFQNISNFIRHFKKIKDVTPSQYRKAWKNSTTHLD